jgi:hypothetical protein
MVAAVVVSNPVGIDKSYAHTDAKEHQNLLALSADGLVKTQVYSATMDPASLADAAGATVQVTGCTGVVLGKSGVRSFTPGVDLVDFTVTSYVQADGVIEVRVQNESGTGANLASSTWYFIVDTVII